MEKLRKNDHRVLTSVRVESDLFEAFKMECIKSKFSLQKLVDRAILLYMEDEEFKSKLHNKMDLEFRQINLDK